MSRQWSVAPLSSIPVRVHPILRLLPWCGCAFKEHSASGYRAPLSTRIFVLPPITYLELLPSSVKQQRPLLVVLGIQ
jgi:hypothetical protein